MADKYDDLRVPAGLQDERKQLTGDDLLKDAAKIIYQLEQFYLPGEVEATVCLSFRGSGPPGAVAIATNVDSTERLRWQISKAHRDAPRIITVVRGRKALT